MRFGRIATVAGIGVSIFTALIASTYSNLMNYLQARFSIFDAPLFATFIIGMFWRRMTPAAGLAFASDAVVTVAVTLRTTPKPVEELQGLVYGMANVDEDAPARRRWWESPRLVGFSVLAGAAAPTIVFW